MPDLIDDSPMKGRQTELVDTPFLTEKLEEVLIKRKEHIVEIRMRGSVTLEEQVEGLCTRLDDAGINAIVV